MTFVLKLRNGLVVDIKPEKANGNAAQKEEDDDDEALDAVDAIIEGKKPAKESDERIATAHAPYFPGVSLCILSCTIIVYIC
jgi:hypothetical protein